MSTNLISEIKSIIFKVIDQDGKLYIDFDVNEYFNRRSRAYYSDEAVLLKLSNVMFRHSMNSRKIWHLTLQRTACSMLLEILDQYDKRSRHEDYWDECFGFGSKQHDIYMGNGMLLHTALGYDNYKKLRNIKFNDILSRIDEFIFRMPFDPLAKEDLSKAFPSARSQKRIYILLDGFQNSLLLNAAAQSSDERSKYLKFVSLDEFELKSSLDELTLDELGRDCEPKYFIIKIHTLLEHMKKRVTAKIERMEKVDPQFTLYYGDKEIENL